MKEAVGADLYRWISKARVQVSVGDIAWDIKCEHGHCRTLDKGLVDKYVDSLADAIQRIEVILKHIAGRIA